MPLKRTTHWATRELHEYLLANAKAPFVWGQHDCCLFAANAVQAFTGFDLAADFRGKYTDKASAFAAVQAITGGTTAEDAVAWCAKKHGLVELEHPLTAQRGDAVVMQLPQRGPDGDQGTLLGGIVHLSGRHLVTIGEGGLVRLPITSVKRAWRI
jgi:hypothetical protein